MKSTFRTITERIIERHVKALEAIAARSSITGAEDADEAEDILRDRLEDAIKTAQNALAETSELRALFQEIQG